MKRSVILATVVAAAGMFVAACGGSSKSTSSSGGGSSSASSTSNADSAAGAKGGTLITLANAAPSGSPDPQVNYTLQEWQFLIITHDGLVGFKRTSGAEGSTLVPDLATTVPTPTDNGRTYQFTLRPGIKFSNGKTVTGQDVKATFERLFKIGDSPNAGTWYNAIEGGDACVKTPKTCDLSKGIVVNGDQITFHLSKGDPEFLQQLALPFAFVLPADTPAKHVDIPPPGTGPYKWAEYKPTTAIARRAQPVLQGVVEGRPARGAAGRHRAEVRPQRPGRGHAGRERPGGLDQPTPTRSRRTGSPS